MERWNDGTRHDYVSSYVRIIALKILSLGAAESPGEVCARFIILDTEHGE